MRRAASAIGSASPQISLSNPLPPASKIPTTCHWRRAIEIDCPTSAPLYRPTVDLPSITSLVAHCGIRPSTTLTEFERKSSQPSFVTPRNPTFAVPLPSTRWSWKMTNISGDATCRPPSMATAGSAAKVFAASRGRKLVSSEVLPLRRMIAF